MSVRYGLASLARVATDVDSGMLVLDMSASQILPNEGDGAKVAGDGDLKLYGFVNRCVPLEILLWTLSVIDGGRENDCDLRVL
jgi:hypothetical protein